MDIKEIKKMKEELETKVKQMILDFEEKSGIFVHDIYLEKQDIYTLNGASENRLIKVKIECKF